MKELDIDLANSILEVFPLIDECSKAVIKTTEKVYLHVLCSETYLKAETICKKYLYKYGITEKVDVRCDEGTNTPEVIDKNGIAFEFFLKKDVGKVYGFTIEARCIDYYFGKFGTKVTKVMIYD
jgi:hypothetical protein